MGGLAILGCLPGSPAAEAGLRYGDILLEVNGQPTPDWAAYVASARTQGTMAVRVFRGGAELHFRLPLSEEPQAPSPAGVLQRVLQSGALSTMARKVAEAQAEAEEPDVPRP